ncbi:hypothetical protein [Bifidobacterium samirii]|uniref:Uncharacterized protein n=1 Tax=Bifidobacterium samirii TaxID=2306974 RepID=A0A430FR46_9BIFI|nr:hypothetical protein [Bifidobacterium samirii]RSX55322.1 hypothetical protein D2E24_1337 [Bifidobacterium samirii]
MVSLDSAYSRPGGMTRRERRERRQAMELRNKNALLALIFPVMIAAKLMVAYILPDNYFYDNTRILKMTNYTLGFTLTETTQEWEGDYRTASDLFAKLNFANLTTMLDWSICLGIIGTALVLFMVLRADAPDLLQSLFILATVGLLNIYIFNIGKDIIQFAFFFAVYLVLLIPLHNSLIKALASAGILYYESTFFREYYILIAALILAVYVVLVLFRRRQRLGFGSMIGILVILYAGIYAMMLMAQRMMPDEYNQMIGLRSGYNTAFGESADSATLIRNWIPGDGLLVFMANYVFNAFRMLIPLELALKGAYYLPFFAFQCMITFYMVNLIRQINNIDDPNLFIALCVYIGYALASFIFEPDFGSWTRHESATFPVLLLLVCNRYQKIPLSQEERMLQEVHIR